MTPLLGPDVNISKGPLDKKSYRQILLNNGLRCVLVSDVAAMNQLKSEGGMLCDDMNEEDSESERIMEEEEKDVKNNGSRRGKATLEAEDENSEGSEEECEASWLRDAAAAVTVGVGSFYDPPECQGLAHFLEHLLFLGSKKYPAENDFDAFMSKHGGEENAFTESETTTYHFSIPQEYLGGALDRLAQFFISPLLLKSGVQREMAAIESEYQLNKQDDHARLQQLWSTTSDNPHHPFSQFQWGNIKSLKVIPEDQGVDTMAKLRSFFDKHYYAFNMRLAVVGAYSLDELQELVVKYYSDIPALPRDGCMANGPPSISWESVYESPLAKEGPPLVFSSPKIFRIVPVKDRHNLSITWQLPSQLGNWKSKPCDYIAHLLGHEAQGSLLSALKKKSWVTTCVAGSGADGMENASSHALFSMTFTLSVEGVNHWPEIVGELYRYIGMLRHYGRHLPEWIYLELRSLHDFAFRFADEPSPEDLVENIVEDMSPHYNLPPDRLLDGGSLLFEHNPQEIQELLLHFSPTNARIDFMSTTFRNDSDPDRITSNREPRDLLDPTIIFDRERAGPPRKEPWFGTSYWVEKLDSEMVQQWVDYSLPQVPPAESLLSLPPKNPFVPTKFDIKSTPPDDCHHPLLGCSLKLCISIGKKKQWLPATATTYNSLNNKLLVSYEDEDEKWHKLDNHESHLSRKCGQEGTFDEKTIKYKVVAVPKDGEAAVRKFGDDSDFDVLDGKSFPPIPPAKPASRLPQLVHTTQNLRLWHMQDRDFLRPIAELRVMVFTNQANDSPLHRACTELLVQLCHDALTETVYMASLCDLGSSFESSENGFGFRIHGFDDKLLQLFRIVFGRLFSFRGRTAEDGLPDDIEPGRFIVCKEMLARKYQNSGMEAPTLASSVRVRCICPGSWSAVEKAEAISQLEMHTFVTIASKVLEKVNTGALIHGNIDHLGAKSAADLIEDVLKNSGGGGLPRKKFYYQYVSKLPSTKKPIIISAPSKDTESRNTAVEIYFQVGKDNIHERVLIDFLIHIMQEPLYSQLRTKEQFGYRVSCDSRWTVGVMGMKFVVVTASKSAAETSERIEKFLVEFRSDLINMTADDFMENLVALAKDKLDMFNSLAEETSCFWSEIRDCRYDWEVNRNEAVALRSVTKDMVVEAFDKWLNPMSMRRAMVVQVISAPQPDNSVASIGRPDIDGGDVGKFCDRLVCDFHRSCKNQHWGKIYV